MTAPPQCGDAALSVLRRTGRATALTEASPGAQHLIRRGSASPHVAHDAAVVSASMELSDVYATTREGLIKLASSLDGGAAGGAVPALPGWTVKDTYGHLAGVCADVLAGNMAGGGTPGWTAKQVSDRAGRSLAEVCAEWSLRGEEIDQWLRAAAGRGSFLCFDVWSHEQDIRCAAGLRGERDDERVPYLSRNAVDVFDGRLKSAGAPSAHVITETIDRVLGDKDAAVTLRCSDYELLRILFGRRSRAQIVGAAWDGDPEPCVDHLHLFDLSEGDLID